MLKKPAVRPLEANSDALLAVPHPKRMELCGALEAFMQGLGRFGAAVLEELLRDTGLTKGEVMRKLASLPGLLEALTNADGRIDLMQLEPLLTPLRYRALGGRIFEIRPELDLLLAHTDIGAQAPSRFFRLPYPSVYLLFGAHGGGLRVINEVENRVYALEGAYISELLVSEGYREGGLFEGIAATGSQRVCEITLVGKPEKGPFDDGYIFARLLFPEQWEDDPLEVLIDRQLAVYESHGLSGLQDQGRQLLRAGVLHVAKALLYLNSERARTSSHAEEQELRERLSRVKGGKRAKLERRLARAYDRILVGPEQHEGSVAAFSGGRSVAAHWRRGHFRSQAHGEGRLLRKLLWIAPTLVAGPDAAIPFKDYDIK